MNIEKILAEEKVLFIERQIRQPSIPGIERTIVCPYCGETNVHDEKLLCCDLLRKAIVMILVGDRALAAAEAGEKAIVH